MKFSKKCISFGKPSGRRIDLRVIKHSVLSSKLAYYFTYILSLAFIREKLFIEVLKICRIHVEYKILIPRRSRN
jgi:hypothetical protein